MHITTCTDTGRLGVPGDNMNQYEQTAGLADGGYSFP